MTTETKVEAVAWLDDEDTPWRSQQLAARFSAYAPRPLVMQSALDALRGEVAAAERRVAECLKFIDGIRDELHTRRVPDWFPEGAHNAAEQMSEDMRLIGNACADFDPAALTKETP